MTDKAWLLNLLSDGVPRTLNEILRRSFDDRGCGLTVHSRISDLRKDGYQIAWWQQPGEKRGNSSVYQLVSLEEADCGLGVRAASPAASASSSEIDRDSPRDLAPRAGSSTGERDVANVEAAGSIPAPRLGDGPQAAQAPGEATARDDGTNSAHEEVPPSPVHPRQLTVWEAA